MFSGKTTHLIQTYYKSIEEGKTPVAINYSGDQRYHATKLSSHDKVMIDCVSTTTLAEVWASEVTLEIHLADVILINEAQFFPDIVPIAMSMVEEFGKEVYIYGLDGDYLRRNFGQFTALLPLADDIMKLYAKCHCCGKKARFTHRLTGETEQVLIGTDNYIPLCRTCYRRMNI